MADRRYLLAHIRELLTQGFDDVELRALCFDVPGFRPVYERLAQSTGKTEIVAQFLEHAERTLQIDLLLILAKELNPVRYELHGPYIIGEHPPPDTSGNGTRKATEGPLSPSKTTLDKPPAAFLVQISDSGQVGKIVNIGQAGDVTID